MSKYHNFPKGAWSHSRFSELRRCQKAHHLRYNVGLRGTNPKGAGLEVGGYVHTVLEHVGNLHLRGFEVTEDDWKKGHELAREDLMNPALAVDGTRIIEEYRDHYGDENAGWGGYDLVGVERVFQARGTDSRAPLHATLGGFAAIADVFVENGDGLAIVERKVLARLPSKDDEVILAGLRTRPQLLALVYCARDELGEIPDVIHEIITKTKEPSFKRLRIRFTDAELDRWAAEQTELEALVPLKTANWDACDPPMGYPCWAFDYCHGGEPGQKLYVLRRSRDGEAASTSSESDGNGLPTLGAGTD